MLMMPKAGGEGAPVVGDVAGQALGRAPLAPSLDGVVVELLEDRLQRKRQLEQRTPC